MRSKHAPKQASRIKGTPITAPQKLRRFHVHLDVEIEIDARLLAQVLTAKWRQRHYQLLTSSDVAGHLAYNMVQGRRLTSLDGFADQPEDAARVVDIYYADEDVTETNTEPPTQSRSPKTRTKSSKKGP